ncbi:GTPase [Aestuariirhabdus sp. LZHN29]|uniref:GTPase n=1 Tax=Aestuariirhabdus sp. LZHN29 TaxID=3417462 RepID=UPI003CEDA1C8
MDSDISQLQLRVPQRTLTELSFCLPAPSALEEWLNGLPKANLGEISRQLYNALTELNKLDSKPQLRFQLLELIRSTVYYTLDALSKHYLGQSVVLNEQQKKVANLAQALQMGLATGYKQVILDCHAAEGERTLCGNAIHRAMAELSRAQLRAYQLYCPPPRYLWLELGQLYQASESLHLLDHEVADKQNHYLKSSTPRTLFGRIALLGCSRPNQLRQADLSQVFDVLELWSSLAEVQVIAQHDPTFIINLEADLPPSYFALTREPVTLASRGLNSVPLMQALQQAKKMPAMPGDDGTLTIPKSMSPELIKHLIQAWGPLKERSFKRISTHGTLQITVGLSATHYFLSGEKDFNEQLIAYSSASRKARFMAGGVGSDAWSSAFDADVSDRKQFAPLREGEEIKFKHSDDKTVSHYQIHETQLEDTSPGGYCVIWPGNLPTQTQSGELIGVRETSTEQWSLAVIRWIKVDSPERALMGVELLTPNAEPCALSLLRKSSDSSLAMRAFLLPEIKAIAQPATLITPLRPFEEGSKILLNQHGHERRGQLTHKIMGTRSFSQFDFKFLQQLLDTQTNTPGAAGADDEDFTSVWKLL